MTKFSKKKQEKGRTPAFFVQQDLDNIYKIQDGKLCVIDKNENTNLKNLTWGGKLWFNETMKSVANVQNDNLYNMDRQHR